MRFACVSLGVVLLAIPAAGQPFILPLQPQQSEAPPAPSPAPVAPPQSGMQPNGPSQAEAQNKAQAGDAADSTQASRMRSDNASHAARQ